MSAQPESFAHREQGGTKREVNGRPQVAAERREDVSNIVGAWVAQNPEANTPFGRENLGRAYAFPSVQTIGRAGEFEQMWVDRFTDDPDLMWLIVGDIVRYVSSDEVPRGERAPSRRQVQGKDRNLATVWRIMHGHYSTDPFPVSVRELIGSKSLRDFAARAGFGSVQTLIRYQRGERPLTMECMESMAKAGRVEPHYFLEYRAMWLGRELQRAMLARPTESLKAVKLVRDSVV